jgi:hypothetical protein
MADERRHEWIAIDGTYFQRCQHCDIRRFLAPDAKDDGLVRDPRTDLPMPCRADDERATIEAAATNAEQRYQEREREMRSAVHDDGILTTAKIDAKLKGPEFQAYLGKLADAYAPENKPTRLERKIEDFAREIAAVGVTPSSLPIRQPLAIAGTFRVYFNRHQAAPLVWCIATDHLEIAVAEVVITSTFGVRTVYQPKATPDDEDGKPSAWLVVDGVLRIDPGSSTARIG